MRKKSKCALANEVTRPILTRNDISALLVAYYGAINLDNVRADELCSCRGRKKRACTESRIDHLRHIYLLLDTLSHVSQEALANLTVVAATHEPTVVRKVLRRLLAEGSSAHLVGERMWSAPEFFNALVEEVGEGPRAPKEDEDMAKRMMRWLDPVDPLRVAQSCGYKKRMPPQLWR